LQEVPGVGPITAVGFVLTIDDPHRFPNSRKVGAYLGLSPRQRDSGNRNPTLGITKAGWTCPVPANTSVKPLRGDSSIDPRSQRGSACRWRNAGAGGCRRLQASERSPSVHEPGSARHVGSRHIWSVHRPGASPE
jgi:transposase